MSYPFSAPLLEQVQALEDNMRLLRAFAEKHPDLQCWAATPMGPCVMFASDQLDTVKSRFGHTGWRLEGQTVTKTVDGVQIEARVPSKEAQEVTL